MPYEIKPLEWKQWNTIRPKDGEREANTVFGRIQVWPNDDGSWSMRPSNHGRKIYESEDNAKLAAQRWHDARLLPALREVKP